MSNWEKSLNANGTNQGEWVTSLHLNPSLEGKVFDKLKKTAKSIFGPNQTQRVENMEKNLGRKFTISEVKKLSNKNLSKLCEKHSDDTTVPMSDIAIAYLSNVAFDKPMVFLSSIMCGNTYSDIVSQTKGYLVAVDQISNGNNQLTTRAQVVKQLGDIEKAIKLGNRANQYMQKVYDNTEQQSIKQISSNMTYLNAVAVLEHLMVEGGTVTKQSTNEYPGIMLDELIEHDIVVGDDKLLRQAKSLRSEFNTMYKYSTKVDEISDKVWKEWQTTQKLRVSIADIYLELTRMNPSNESISWANSLSPATEAGVIAKLKDKASKLFGIGDQKRVDKLRASGNTKIPTEQLLIVKDKTVSGSFYNYLKTNNKKTTTAKELDTFCLSAGLLKQERNLQQSLMYASGKSPQDLFNKLVPLMKQIDDLEGKYTDMSVDKCISEMNSIITKINSLYASINKAMTYSKPVKAANIKPTITHEQILAHHHDIVNTYWKVQPDTPFKILNMVKTLKKSNNEYADKLDAVQARFEGIREELKTTAAHTWTVTIEWLLLTNMEIKTANIFDDILKAKPSNESSEHTMTVDSVMAEWGDAIKGWQDGVEYTPGNEDDDNKDMGEVSDGYHTFNELYEHRTTLFSIILNQNKDKGWKSKLHDDGTMFDNYFIAGITTPEGEYTYHQSMDWWDKFDVEERERAPAWDGHKPEDITRLYSLLK